MNKPSLLSCIFLGAAAAAGSLAAQTAPAKPATSATAHATTAHPAASHGGGCVAPTPAISSKIPPVPAGSLCVKVLYTVTRMPTTKLVYASPLVSPELRESLGSETVTYSLDYIDTKIGTGEPAAAHKFYTVRYTGYLADAGTKFDSSDDHPNKEPISFPYGGHRVIPGWDTGFEGMKVGGKRRLFVPYELAYGENGRPPVIPAKAELIFDVELVSQSDSQPTPPPGAHSGPPAGRPMPPGGQHPPTGVVPPTGPGTAAPAGNPPATPTPPPSGTPPAGNPPAGTTPPPSGSATPPAASTPPKPQ